MLGLCARTEPSAPEGADPQQVHTASVDVTDEAALEAFAKAVIDRFGRIDLWVNNAGLLDPIAPLRDVEVADFRRHIDVNLTGLFWEPAPSCVTCASAGRGGAHQRLLRRCLEALPGLGDLLRGQGRCSSA